MSPNGSRSPKSPLVKRKTTNMFNLINSRNTGMLSKKTNTLSMFNNNKTLYTVGGEVNISNILYYNPKIELKEFTISGANKLNINNFNKLYINNEFYAQNVIFNDNGRTVLQTFELIGSNKIKKETKKLLNDIQINNLYVDEKLENFYLFSYDVANYKYYNKEIADKIFNELKKDYDLNLIDDKIDYYDDEYDDENKRMEDLNYRFFKKLNLKRYPPDTNSRSGSPITGGSNKSIKTKYIKTLRNKTLEKLQNMAKNKKVKYTKKVDGKSVAIKKETLIKKLCKHKYGK
jgi:hypothetical protein